MALSFACSTGTPVDNGSTWWSATGEGSESGSSESGSSESGSSDEGGGGARLLEDELLELGDDGWRPGAEVQLSCPWVPQVLPGSWSATLNSGPASLLMVEACMSGLSAGSEQIVGLIEWMDAELPSYGGVGSEHNGSSMNTVQLVEAIEGRYGRKARRFTGASLASIYEQLLAGRPVVVLSETQSGNMAPSDEMLDSEVGQFMVVVGMTPTHVFVHDPGWSSTSNGQARAYRIDSFVEHWQGHAGVSFAPAEDTIEGGLESCNLVGGLLTARGEIRSEFTPISKWRISIADITVSSGMPGTDLVDIYTPIDISGYLGLGPQTARLSAQLEGGEELEIDSCQFECSDGCQPVSPSCGNGVLEPGEDCDGPQLGSGSCEAAGYDQGNLGCALDCSYDLSACEVCEVSFDGVIGEWTPEFAPDTDCSCDEANPKCRSLYRGRVEALSANLVDLGFQKAEGGAPSADVGYWVVVGEPEPVCESIPHYVERSSGAWSSELERLVVSGVSVWPSEADFEAAAEGETKNLFVITGGGENPDERTWMQERALNFTKECAPQ